MTYNFILPTVFFYYPLARLLDWLIRSGRYLNTQRNTNHKSKKTRAEVDSFFTKPIPKKTPKSSVKTDIFPQNLTFEILSSTVFLQRHPNIILDWRKLHKNFGGTQPETNAGWVDVQFDLNLNIRGSCPFSILFTNLYLFSFLIQSKDIAYKLQFVHYGSFYPRF